MKKKENDKTLFPSKMVKINGEYLEVHPYSWGATVKAAVPLAAVIDAGLKNVKYINDLLYSINTKNDEVFTYQLAIVLEDIMKEAGDELIELLRLSINKSPKWIRSCNLQNFCDLLIVVYSVNESFFKRLLVVDDEVVSGNGNITAAQAAVILIEYGHRYDDVLEKYTPEQIVLFLKSIIARELYKKADNAEAVMLGIGGSFSSANSDDISKILLTMKGSDQYAK